MEEKFTKGPWHAEISQNQFEKSGWLIKVVGDWDGEYGDDIAVVTTRYAKGGRKMPIEEARANANLMALAPEMFAALKIVARGDGRWCHDCGWAGYHPQEIADGKIKCPHCGSKRVCCEAGMFAKRVLSGKIKIAAERLHE